jgi:hypothetical protein
MIPYLEQCAAINEDGPVAEECIINGAEICPIGKIINGKGQKFN